MSELEPQMNDRLSVLAEYRRPPWRIVPLAGDASTRKYFRAFHPDGRSVIIMALPEAGQNQEASFLEVRRFLETLGLPVPKLIDRLPDAGLLVLEDLGDDLLEDVLIDSDEKRVRDLYEQAVDLLIALRRSTDPLTGGCPAYSLAFDMEKLMQEMDFFMTHFVRGFSGIEPSQSSEKAIYEFFESICSTLSQEPRVFAHRDYHARNLLVTNRGLVMIDFQDARMGPAQYDLASLLRDSYVRLTDDLVQSMVERYAEAFDVFNGTDEFERFTRIFDLMSLQRNIKALGTFGYQATVMGATRYLSSIPRTGLYIRRNMAKYQELTRFVPVTEELVCSPAASVCVVC